VVPLAIAQHIFRKFVASENVEPTEIVPKLRAQCGDETLVKDVGI
jgi:hypothetical protein